MICFYSVMVRILHISRMTSIDLNVNSIKHNKELLTHFVSHFSAKRWEFCVLCFFCKFFFLSLHLTDYELCFCISHGSIIVLRLSLGSRLLSMPLTRHKNMRQCKWSSNHGFIIFVFAAVADSEQNANLFSRFSYFYQTVTALSGRITGKRKNWSAIK